MKIFVIKSITPVIFFSILSNAGLCLANNCQELAANQETTSLSQVSGDFDSDGINNVFYGIVPSLQTLGITFELPWDLTILDQIFFSQVLNLTSPPRGPPET